MRFWILYNPPEFLVFRRILSSSVETTLTPWCQLLNIFIYHILKFGIRTDKKIRDTSNFDFFRKLIYLILTEQQVYNDCTSYNYKSKQINETILRYITDGFCFNFYHSQGNEVDEKGVSVFNVLVERAWICFAA